MHDAFVCNASPLILLARVERLDLLQGLARSVLVPEAVLDELDAGNARDGAADMVRAAGFFQHVADQPVDELLRSWQLGRGETQVLMSARRTPGSHALLDDRAARRCAETLGIPLVGTIGVVALARRQDLVPEAAPLYAALCANGLRSSPSLIARILQTLGETR